MLTWTDIDIRGKRAAFCDVGEARLYVAERHGVVEAWISSEKVGNFETLEEAKGAALRRAGQHPSDPLPATATKPFALKPWPVPKPEPKPVADKPLINGGLSQCSQFTNPAPHSEMRVQLRDPEDAPRAVEIAKEALSPPLAGLCSCGAKLGRSGKCPALCEPVPETAPVYDGPRFVGTTHTAKLGAPVTW